MQFVDKAKQFYGIFAKASKKGYRASKKYAAIACNMTKRYAIYVAKKAAESYNFCIEKVFTPAFLLMVKFFKRSPRAFAACIAVVVLISSTATVAVATDATAAYSVIYNGVSIATIKDHAVLAEAEILAVGKLNNPICNSHLIDAKLTQTIASEDSLVCPEDLADIIIFHSENIVTSTVLEIDGNQVAVGANEQAIESALSDYLAFYKESNGVNEVKFSNEMKTSKVYTLKSAVEKLPDVKEYLFDDNTEIAVQNIKTVVETTSLPYETIEIKSASHVVGTKFTSQAGTNGKQEITYRVCEVDGVEVEKTVISKKVVKAAVPRKVIVGTKKAETSATTAVSMLWPVKRVKGSYVSSYVGDGRGHKGMDIVAPAGTPIYAARQGVVTYAGWDRSGYGNKVIVKHKNGVETLYAHCSVIKVKVGDVVGEGQEIALVGTTGRSTGNHLHFEVRVNGCFTNPAKYIGRK